jgi:hypothetical protein
MESDDEEEDGAEIRLDDVLDDEELAAFVFELDVLDVLVNTG